MKVEKMSYITGTYTKEIFKNERNDYVIGLIKVKDSDIDKLIGKTIDFVGIFPDLIERTNYTMYGELIKHPKYGEQFNVNNYELYLPTKEEELVEFLSSDFFPIGEKTASKIVEKFKDKTLEIISNEPDKLLSIPRLTESRIKKIKETLDNLEFSSKTMIKLKELGFTNKESLTLLKKYQDKVLTKIEENIYDFIDSDEISFTNIDRIALNMGIPNDDERRILALIIHTMKELTFNQGDTYLYLEELSKSLNIDQEHLEEYLEKLQRQNKIVIEENKYYLKKFYEAEKYIVDRLCFLNDMTKHKLPKLEEKLEELEKINNITYDDTQRQAIIKSLNNNITIITGGPGTGKTTIIKAITYLLQYVYKAKPDDIALLAPTGRAAKKMMETTNLKALTIHRYLAWDKDTNIFSINEYNPNPQKYIIIDETSMIDTLLMEALLKGIRRDAKIILVGDYYQLPSVAQGQILKDLIDSDLIDTIKLNSIYRQTEDSYILNLAQEIKDKDISESFLMKKEDYNFINCPKEQVPNLIQEIVKKAISKGYTDKEIQILSPMYKTPSGIDNLNILLQEIFNPPSPNKNEISLSEVTYRVGDKILQLVNDTDNNVYNGDIGYITDITKNKTTKKREIIVNFDGNKVAYLPDKYINIKHGYAITIHKAQGSEFPMVIMPIINSFNRMLYNKLVYTAVTRAKDTLMIVGTPESFLYGVKNDYIDNRKTTIKEMIIKKYIY